MRHSIRFKLFLYMTVSIVIFAVLLYGFNTFFLENYYINHKKNSLIEVSQKISELIQGKNTEELMSQGLTDALENLERRSGTSISIGRTDGLMYYPHMPNITTPQRIGYNPFFVLENNGVLPSRQNQRRPEPQQNEIKGWERESDNSFFIITEDPRFMINTLRYQVALENNLTLLVWIPMAEISESAAVANRFTSWVALLTVLITGLWALFISGRFTKPIKEMNKVTREMSELNFSRGLEINSNDEIGQLSHSINHLSTRLDEAISELDGKNRQLEQDIDRERRIDKLRREFVSSVSHELKTPLFLIQGYAEGLKTNVVQDEAKRNFYCDVIMDEAEKMDILVKDLLDLSIMEAGMFSIKKIHFDLALLVRDTVKKMEPALLEKKINLTLNIPGHLAVNADPVRTEQVVVNFLNNALNHCNAKKIIKVELTAHGTNARVAVFNSGPHIPEEDLEKIWTSFYKVDKARTRKSGGMGLGLSIVKAIQEADGNAFGVNNVKDGVEFWFKVDADVKD